jgi:spore coat protein A, manganese oxidase
MGVTRLNVYAGLAGFYIIHDAHEKALVANHNLPSKPYDIPLAIQDRLFATDGQLYYPADPEPGTTAEYPSVHPEFFGDTILVNGKARPVLNVEPRMYRFRVLDGSNSRFYNLHFDTGQSSFQSFYQIGDDQGLLRAPVPLNGLLIAPGERADIVVDFSKLAGKTIIMTNDAKGPFPKGTPADRQTTGQIMAFHVKPLSEKTQRFPTRVCPQP